MLPDRLTWLSGYRLLWMLVMFDLPVVDKKDRRAYQRFRDFLMDEGFARTQYSIYMRLLPGKEAVEKYDALIHRNLPDNGKVQVVVITDKQYENIRTYEKRESKSQKNPRQLALF